MRRFRKHPEIINAKLLAVILPDNALSVFPGGQELHISTFLQEGSIKQQEALISQDGRIHTMGQSASDKVRTTCGPLVHPHHTLSVSVYFSHPTLCFKQKERSWWEPHPLFFSLVLSFSLSLPFPLNYAIIKTGNIFDVNTGCAHVDEQHVSGFIPKGFMMQLLILPTVDGSTEMHRLGSSWVQFYFLSADVSHIHCRK